MSKLSGKTPHSKVVRLYMTNYRIISFVVKKVICYVIFANEVTFKVIKNVNNFVSLAIM